MHWKHTLKYIETNALEQIEYNALASSTVVYDIDIYVTIQKLFYLSCVSLYPDPKTRDPITQVNKKLSFRYIQYFTYQGL